MDCNVIITNKFGNKVTEKVTLPDDNKNNILDKLSHEALQQVKKIADEVDGDSVSVVLDNTNPEFVKNVYGNFSMLWFRQMVSDSFGHNFSEDTNRLISIASEAGMDEGNVILYSSFDYSSDNSSDKIKGALIRRNKENPLILIKGEDGQAIENTLRHELTHFLFDKIIDENSELQTSLLELISKIDKKGASNQSLINSLKTVTDPKEIFAYVTQDQGTYEDFKRVDEALFNQLNELLFISNPSGSISHSKMTVEDLQGLEENLSWAINKTSNTVKGLFDNLISDAKSGSTEDFVSIVKGMGSELRQELFNKIEQSVKTIKAYKLQKVLNVYDRLLNGEITSQQANLEITNTTKIEALEEFINTVYTLEDQLADALASVNKSYTGPYLKFPSYIYSSNLWNGDSISGLLTSIWLDVFNSSDYNVSDDIEKLKKETIDLLKANLSDFEDSSAESQSSPALRNITKSDVVFYSGGANGSDQLWETQVRDGGYKIESIKANHIDTLNDALRLEVEEAYQEVRTVLQRREPSNQYSKNLVRRNMLQVKDATQVIGIVEDILDEKKGIVEGGTAYAVMRGIIKKIPVFVFNQNDNSWYKYEEGFIKVSQDDVNIIPGAALVGTRNISETGKKQAGYVFEKFDEKLKRNKNLEQTTNKQTTKKVEWARKSDKGYELSSKGDTRFSALSAKFAPGTIFEGHDVGGMTIESVYQNGIKQNDWVTDNNSKTGKPSTDSMLFNPYTVSPSQPEFIKQLVKIGRFQVPDPNLDYLKKHDARRTDFNSTAKQSGSMIVFKELIDINKFSKASLSKIHVNSELMSKLKSLQDEFKSLESLDGINQSNARDEDYAKALATQFKEANRRHVELLTEVSSSLWGVDLKTKSNRYDAKDTEGKQSNMNSDQLEDYSFEVGYLPLWELWASQNEGLIADLQQESSGKVLTDTFATTRVNQARALARILNKRDQQTQVQQEQQMFLNIDPADQNVIPYQEELTKAFDFDRLAPGLKWDTEKKTFQNIDELHDFFNNINKSEYGLNTVWHEDEEIKNESQVVTARAGDLIKINSLEYLSTKDNMTTGLFGPAFKYGTLMTSQEILDRINSNLSDLDTYRIKLNREIEEWNKYAKKSTISKLTDDQFNKIVEKQIKFKSKYFVLENGYFETQTDSDGNTSEVKTDDAKYLNYTKNYVLGRVFYNNVKKVYQGYIAVKFPNNKKAVCVRVDLSPTYVKSIRRMDDDFRTSYEKDDKGELVKKVKSEKYHIDKVPKHVVDKSKKSLTSLNAVLNGNTDEDALIKNVEYKGSKFVAQSKLGLMISGFYGDLKQELADSQAGDYVKYIESRNQDKKVNSAWGVKVMDLPNGILIMKSDGKYKIVNKNNVSAVVFNKEGIQEKVNAFLNLRKEVKDSMSFNSRKNSKTLSTYPFFAVTDADERVKMAKTLKPGDVIDVVFQMKDGTAGSFLTPIIYKTTNTLYYVANSGEVKSVNIADFTEGKFVKRSDGTYTYSNNIPKAFIRAAYVDHVNDHLLLSYFNEYRSQMDKSFGSKMEFTDKENFVDIRDITSEIVGELENSRNPLSGRSLNSEWNVISFEGNDDLRARKVANIQKGDIVKTQFTDNSGNVKSVWGMVIGKDPITNVPKVALYDSNGKLRTFYRDYNSILAIGERSLPLYFDPKDNKYYNISGEGRTLVSEGRPEQLKTLKEKYKTFFETGLQHVYMSEKEYKDNQNKIKRKLGNNALVEVHKVKDKITGKIYYVQAIDPTKHEDLNETTGKLMNSFSGGNAPARQYQLSDKTASLYNIHDASFDELTSVINPGDVIKMQVEYGQNQKIFPVGIVTEVHNGVIQVATLRVQDENGQRKYDYKTQHIFKNQTGGSTTTVIELIGSDTDAIIALGKELKTRKKSSKSKELSIFQKSLDNFDTINTISSKLQDLYGIKSTLVTNEDMQGLSLKYGENLQNARAFAVPSTNEIFINTDKASIAEPLHELAHILMPGLKARNFKAYKILMEKVRNHPDYQNIANGYTELTGYDLDEEVFVTIFAEYYRTTMMTSDQFNWYDGTFKEFTDNSTSVFNDLFETRADIDSDVLLDMSIQDIFNDFGSQLMRGKLQKTYSNAVQINANSAIQKLYKSLIDKGKLIKNCY